MSKTLTTEYRSIRRKYPRLPAKQAFLWAKGLMKPTELDWQTLDGNHFATAETERDGFDIRITVDYDEYAETRVSFTDKDTGIRNPEYRYSEYGWTLRSDRTDRRYIELESGYTLPQLAKDYREAGMSKGVAWDEARKSLQDEAKMYLGEDYVQVVITAKALIDGIELGDATIGTDFDIDYGTIERELDDMVVETGIIEEAIADARKNLDTVLAAERARLARMEALTP